MRAKGKLVTSSAAWAVRVAVLAVLLFPGFAARAQEPAPVQQSPRHVGAFWAGYMSNWGIRPPWSIWFDTHYNTRAFFVLRGGLTYRFDVGPSITAGYAHLWLDPGNDTLSRNEHRPWMQVFLPFRFSDKWGVSQRLRWDVRIRQNVQDGAVVGGWTTVQRFRFQFAATYWLPKIRLGRLFLQAADEILFNAGRNAGPNYLDQNRISLMIGWRIRGLQIRTGYMDRFVPGASGLSPVHEHVGLLWVNQDIWLPRGKTPGTRRPPPAEGGNP